MSDGDQLLNIRELAERWDVSIQTAKQHVRKAKVPFIKIGAEGDMRINWSVVRFRASAVLKWEQESEQVFEPAEPVVQAPAAGKWKYTKM